MQPLRYGVSEPSGPFSVEEVIEDILVESQPRLPVEAQVMASQVVTPQPDGTVEESLLLAIERTMYNSPP